MITARRVHVIYWECQTSYGLPWERAAVLLGATAAPAAQQWGEMARQDATLFMLPARLAWSFSITPAVLPLHGSLVPPLKMICAFPLIVARILSCTGALTKASMLHACSDMLMRLRQAVCAGHAAGQCGQNAVRGPGLAGQSGEPHVGSRGAARAPHRGHRLPRAAQTPR